MVGATQNVLSLEKIFNDVIAAEQSHARALEGIGKNLHEKIGSGNESDLVICCYQQLSNTLLKDAQIRDRTALQIQTEIAEPFTQFVANFRQTNRSLNHDSKQQLKEIIESRKAMLRCEEQYWKLMRSSEIESLQVQQMVDCIERGERTKEDFQKQFNHSFRVQQSAEEAERDYKRLIEITNQKWKAFLTTWEQIFENVGLNDQSRSQFSKHSINALLKCLKDEDQVYLSRLQELDVRIPVRSIIEKKIQLSLGNQIIQTQEVFVHYEQWKKNNEHKAMVTDTWQIVGDEIIESERTDTYLHTIIKHGNYSTQILKQLIAQIKLDIELKGCQFKILKNQKVIVIHNDFNQIAVCRIIDQNNFEYFSITKGISEMGKCNGWQFLLSKKENIILCRAEESPNQLILFSINISKQQINDYRKIKVDGIMLQVKGQFQSQLYQILRGRIRIISYKKFPKITRSIFQIVLSKSQIISYGKIKFIKFINKDGKLTYYRLPLRRKSSQEVNYSVRSVKRILMIKTRNLIKQLQIGATESCDLKICRADNLQIPFMVYRNTITVYNKKYNIFKDEDEGVKFFQIRPKTKIIRCLKQVKLNKEQNLKNQRYIVVYQLGIGSKYSICDVATNILFYLSDSIKITVADNIFISLNVGLDLLIYDLKYQRIRTAESQIK